MNYRGDFREVQRDAYWSVPRIAALLIVGGVLIGGAGWVVSILAQPARIVSKTFDADNVISNYEWYRDAYGNFQAKTRQVSQFKSLFASEGEPQERNRLRIEMAAVQQSCRDLAQRYNANANKINRSIFMGTSVPANLEASQCE